MFLVLHDATHAVHSMYAVPIQTVGEAPYRIREFRLRFFASETMWQPPQEVG